MSAPQAQTQAPPQPKRGVVKQILSGDTVVIRGVPRGGPPPEKTLYLSNINAPKLAKRPTGNIPETKDEPFAWEAREFLRKKLIGKEITFYIEYSVSGRDYCTVFLGNDRSGENIAESLVSEGLVDVRTGGKGEEYQRLCELRDSAQSARRGKYGDDASLHVRDVKWTLRDDEDPRTFVDRLGRKPQPAVVEHVRDGSTVRVLLLPDFHYITLMLSGIRCPSTRPDETSDPSSIVKEAQYFTESRLLQRDVEVVLEGATNQNFVGSVLHPNGNIAEALLKVGMAKCVDWSLSSVFGGAEKLKAAEKEAKDKRLRLWKDYTPSGVPLDAKDQKFEGKVMEVINADALVVKVADGELRKIFLSSIRPPRRPEEPKTGGGEPGKDRNFRPLYDIPFMYEAREFLRKKLIGKNVVVCVDYKQPASNSFPEKTCCTVTIGGVNVAEALVGKGLATVVRYRQDDDQRSAHYNDLLAAEMKAQKSSRGLHSKKDVSGHRVVDLAGDLAKSKQFLPFLQRGGKMEALVEFVAGGSRVRLYIPRENCLATFLLAGISCPRAARSMPGGQQVEGEPWGNEALQFTKRHCLQREVEVEVDSMDKAGNFIGWLTVEGLNLSVALVQEGLATVHFTAERSQHFRALQLAEEAAKKRGDKIWAGYEESEETKTQEVISERKVNYRNVCVTEVKPDLSFYIQFYDDGKKLEEMTSLLRQELEQNPPMPGAYVPKKGEVCAAKFKADNEWYRAKVEKVHATGGAVDIFYLDYGNRETTDASHLASLPSTLGIRDLPPSAKEYSLALITLPKDPEQVVEAQQAFQHEVSDQELKLNVEYKTAGQEFVTLVAKSSGNDVAKTLLQEGWVLLEERRDKHLQELVREYAAAQDQAKAKRLNLWCYGDVTEDDSKEFGWGR